MLEAAEDGSALTWKNKRKRERRCRRALDNDQHNQRHSHFDAHIHSSIASTLLASRAHTYHSHPEVVHLIEEHFRSGEYNWKR